MYILNQIKFSKKKTTYSSFMDCYGVGSKTSKKLNAILLNKPNAKEFKYDLNNLVRTKEGKNIFSLPSEISLKSLEFNNLLHLAEIKTYKAYIYTIINKLSKASLYLDINKSNFIVIEVKYLELILTTNRLKIDLLKVKIVLD